MPRNARWPLLFALYACLNSCASPPDVPACEHLGQRLAEDPVTRHLVLSPSPTCTKRVGEKECGHCVKIVSGREFFVGEKKDTWFNGKPWSQIRRESILLPAVEAYAPLSSYLINECKKASCNGDVTRFRVKLGTLNEVVKP